jgi:dolichyl-phosphate-mannose-protein mannosyltransferase
VTSDTATHARDAASSEGGDFPDPAGWQRRLSRYGYSPRPRASTRERLVPPMPEPSPLLWRVIGLPEGAARRLARLNSWIVTLVITLAAGGMRFWRLGSPHAVIFDETYYAKDAWSLLHLGYEGTWPDAKQANREILAHHQTIPLDPAASYIVHPPVGKWTIAIGESIFGLNPFGWRCMLALLGTLSVLMLCRIGRRLFRSTALGCLAGGLMAVDGLHLVMSRTALLDLVVMFWVLAAFGCLLIDRDRARARLAAALPGDAPCDEVASRLFLGLRPWRLAAGVCLGLATATKWNGLYVLLAFCLMSVLWDAAGRRVAGARVPYASTALRDAPLAFLVMVPVALLVYLLSWTGWLVTDKGYFRTWAQTHPSSLPTFLNPLRSLWHYHAQMYEFHTHLTEYHIYRSNPWSWLVLGRPVSYYYVAVNPKPGVNDCAGPGQCAREVLALGTPLLWWTAVAALVYLLYRCFFRRDWRAGAILTGVAAGYLPWFLYQQRTIFYFYSVVFVPFLCLAVAMTLGAILGPSHAPERRRMWGAVASGVLVLLIIWNFVYFFPLYTGMTIPSDAWRSRMWLDTWI